MGASCCVAIGGVGAELVAEERNALVVSALADNCGSDEARAGAGGSVFALLATAAGALVDDDGLAIVLVGIGYPCKWQMMYL